MHIAVDAAAWGNQRGYGRQARALFSVLVELDKNNCYTFFVDSPDYLPGLPPGTDFRLVKTDQPAAQAASASGRRSLADLWRMSRALSAPGFDLVIFPTVYSYVPVISCAKKLVFIHDTIPEKFPELTFANRTARAFWQIKHALARRQADVIVTVSEYSKRCLVETLHLSPECIFVVGEASDPVFQALPAPALSEGLTNRTGLRAVFASIVPNRKQSPSGAKQSPGEPGPRLIVYVGGFGPHKNLTTLVDAFAGLNKNPTYGDCCLVLVGEYKNEVFFSYYDQIRSQIAASGLAERVIWTGFLPDEELVVLLNQAAVLVLPSLMEGFGLPAIEAAACGCPVIATQESPLPELLGAGGLYIDPGRPEALEAALVRVLDSPELRREMSAAGLAAAARLTWEAAAGELLGVIEQAVSS
jgi:glycosyltransferase involved in cell wall biosynthesis